MALPGAPGGFNRLAVAIAPSNPDVAYAWGARGATAVPLAPRRGHLDGRDRCRPASAPSQAWYDWFLRPRPTATSRSTSAHRRLPRRPVGHDLDLADISNKGAAGDSIHPDQHAIAFEPGNPNMIYVGCDGGLFRSPNRGINWQHCNNGLVISEFEYLAQHPGSARLVVGGTQDNGTERWTGSRTWKHVADGDGGDCGVNRTHTRAPCSTPTTA